MLVYHTDRTYVPEKKQKVTDNFDGVFNTSIPISILMVI